MRLRLTATPTRKDGHHPIIYVQCGPVRFFLSPKKAAKFSQLRHKGYTSAHPFLWNGSENENPIHEIYAALIADAPRNDMIVNGVRQALLDERSPLVLTSRTEHLDYLAGRIRGRLLKCLGRSSTIAAGPLSWKHLPPVLRDFRKRHPQDRAVFVMTALDAPAAWWEEQSGDRLFGPPRLGDAT